MYLNVFYNLFKEKLSHFNIKQSHDYIESINNKFEN